MCLARTPRSSVFFYNDPPTPQIYTLSLHDALPIWRVDEDPVVRLANGQERLLERPLAAEKALEKRSEEHTSELQSLRHIVCRLLLEKKNAGSGGRSRGRATALVVEAPTLDPTIAGN